MTPHHITAVQWEHALSVARQACARIFRDGGAPSDALDAFGLGHDDDDRRDWSRAVELIAETICAQPSRRAA